MRQRNRVRHIFLCLVGCIAEHHTLVTSADCFQLFLRHLVFFCFQSLVNAHCDIGGLLVDRNHNGTGVAVKAILRLVIADLLNRLTNDLRDIYICVGGDLAGYQYETGTACCLAGYTAHRVFFHQCVQNCVGNGIAHFVGMSFCYRLRSK